MLITVTFLLTLGTIAADIFVWLRRVRRSGSVLRRRLFAAWCILSDLLPFAIAVVNWTSSDNTTPVMSFSMWCFWLYLLLVLPRLLYYVFRLCRLPRVGAVAGVALAAALVWGATYGRTKLVVNRVTVRSERLPASFDGFRVRSSPTCMWGRWCIPNGNYADWWRHSTPCSPTWCSSAAIWSTSAPRS